jgi:hypothetical protein
LHEPSGDFHQVGLPSRASLRIPSRNRLTDRDSSHGLCFPTAHAESKVPIANGLPADRGYARRVCLPSRRFAPFDASPVLFRTGSAHGVRPSKRSPRERHPTVSRRKHPHTVSIAAQERPKVFIESERCAVPGFCSFRESLAIEPVFSGSIAGCSLGFHSFRAVGQRPCRDFARTPLTCLRCVSEPTQWAPQSINRLLLGLAYSRRQAAAKRQTTLVEFLRLLTPEHSSGANSRAMGSPHAASRVAADDRRFLRVRSALPELLSSST